MSKLVIVESPTKSKTIEKFLGKDYKVLSSYGHLRDLPQKSFGVDLENNFEPKYVIPPKSKKVVSELKKEAKKADEVILATDEDREGEAISWHLSEVLGLDNPKRIVFHEITRDAIEKAMAHPRNIDMNLVNAQQARRILDRIVGYKLSPFLWKKVARGLSAGRVQSVAVRLVVEREKEREKFRAEEYWEIESLLEKEKKFKAKLFQKDGRNIEKLEIKSKGETDKILNDLEGADYIVSNIEKKETAKNPAPPFTTSSLQQEAWNRFRYPARLTMRIAQELYEKGCITYHRTDSVNLSELSLGLAKNYIEENIGKEYWAFRTFKSKGKAQEAHEAIRPSYPEKTPEGLELEKTHFKLYDLIWRRFIASQMSQAKLDSTAVEIKAGNYGFKATGQILKFDGFLRIYPTKFEETELPDLKINDPLNLKELTPSQHFTQPPPRYTEASLIKTLEENGIGRPSTYAPILSTIQARNYIEKDENKRFKPTEIGTVVNDILVEHFPTIVDINFTAKMENELDEVADGKDDWIKICQDFYGPFKEKLAEKYEEVNKKDITDKPTGKNCPDCGSPLIEKLGRYGKFYACSKFPECKHTESLKENKLNIKCPKCARGLPAGRQGNLVEKRTKRRKIFYGCDKFPACDCALWDKPVNEFCPKCNSILIETKRKHIKCSNKDCDFVKKEVK
ncbi:MAG: type I DNA topoisomerase [bacterium]|nr:type I DNA topoisomerase [bacterium]